MLRSFALMCSTVALLAAMPAQADTATNNLARDLDRTESVRAVKTLQRDYAQYAQYGQWNQAAALFANDGQFIFDGQIKEAQTAKGQKAIGDWLRHRYGGDHEGMTDGDLSVMMIENPLVNLSADGNSAKARWDALIYRGHASNARAEGGIFENDYVRENGKWKIATAHYYPQYDGAYETGWTNWGGGELPIVPHHFTVDTSGVPIIPSTDAAPETKTSLPALQKRIDDLNDADRVMNLQAIYGYYQDRKMWDDVTDMFAKDGVFEVGGQGVWKGPAGIRRYLETMGPAGLKHGQLNDRGQYDVTVTVSPGGNEAWTRGIELGMLGEADKEQGQWEITTFRNRFVKEDGVWKIKEIRRFVQMKADVFKGWGTDHIVDPVPTGANAPDAPVPVADKATPASLAMPAFLTANPVTGKPIIPAGKSKLVATSPLTGAIPAGKSKPVDVAEAARRLSRSAAYDGSMNVSAAYGYYLDDNMPQGFAGIISDKGFKESPFAGFYVTRDRVMAARAATRPAPPTRPGISYHWLTQPALFVSDDGRSVTGHIRLFQPRTGKTVSRDFNSASFWGGMYYNQYVLERGIWRLYNLTLDEPLINPVSWKEGIWAKSKDPAPGNKGFGGGLGGNFAPDVTLKSIGKREEHWNGGTGTPTQWPTIMPVWFEFTNPVSGRKPELFQEDCVPCLVKPELRLDRNGYQTPPDAPQANKSP